MTKSATEPRSPSPNTCSSEPPRSSSQAYSSVLWLFAGFSNTTRHFLLQSLSQAASLTWKISGPSSLTPCHRLPKVLITPTQGVGFHSHAFSQVRLPWSPSWPPSPQIRVGLPVLCHSPHPIFNDFWSESHILLCLQWALWGQGTCPCVHHCTPNPWRSAWKL